MSNSSITDKLVRPSDTLMREFIAYSENVRSEWDRKNRPQFKNVWEVMSDFEREQVNRVIADWAAYIGPLADAWWKERGYKVIWPNDNSKPMQYEKLE